MMYAMTLSRSFSATRKFGIVGWDVWSQTASARPVIPGVFATLAKVGASGFGDLISVSVIAWTCRICTRKREPSTRVTVALAH